MATQYSQWRAEVHRPAHLVTGANVLRGAADVHTLCNVGALLLNGDNDVARLVVHACGWRRKHTNRTNVKSAAP